MLGHAREGHGRGKQAAPAMHCRREWCWLGHRQAGTRRCAQLVEMRGQSKQRMQGVGPALLGPYRRGCSVQERSIGLAGGLGGGSGGGLKTQIGEKKTE